MTISRQLLSGSTNGRGVKVAATASRLAGFAVFPSYITNDQATLLATAA